MTTRRTFITGLLASAVAPACPNPFGAFIALAGERYTHTVYQMGFTVDGDYVTQANLYAKGLADSFRLHNEEIERQLVERLFTPGEQPARQDLPQAAIPAHKRQTGVWDVLEAPDRS